MGRFRKTFSEALECAKELRDSKNLSVEKAAKKAADMYGEDVDQLIRVLSGKRLIHKQEDSSIRVAVADKIEQPKPAAEKKKTEKKSTKESEVKTDSSPSNKEEKKEATLKKFEYNGPADIICFNGGISTINICELISAKDENEAKEKLYEKLFNNRLPIFIKSNNWKKCIHEA